jgi:hypothetical protein
LRYLPEELKDRSKVHSPSLSISQTKTPTKLSANEGKKESEQSSNTLDPTHEKLRQIQEEHEKSLRDLERKNVQIQEAVSNRDNWKRRYEDLQNNLRESPEFQKASRQIEIAYEGHINHWRLEYEKINNKFQEINRIPKTIEFSPNRLGCVSLILENQDGTLYLQPDGFKVTRVAAVNPNSTKIGVESNGGQS